MSPDKIDDLLEKYDLDELLDMFLARGLTQSDFMDRFSDFVELVQIDEAER